MAWHYLCRQPGEGPHPSCTVVPGRSGDRAIQARWAGVVQQGGVHSLVQERLLQLGGGGGEAPPEGPAGTEEAGRGCAIFTPPGRSRPSAGGSALVGQEDPGEDSREAGHRRPREEVESTLGNPLSSGEEMGAETGLSGEGSVQLKREEGIGGPPCCPWAGSQGDGRAGGESPSRLSRDPWEN